jgi:glycosyltransferase involved in cell wall biosynthesis
MVPYTKVPLYINASDVCVAPKIPLTSGYSPLKLCEYLACEKPVIASDVSGFEILTEFNMGLLVPPEDEISLAQALIKLLDNPDLGRTMGRNGRNYVVENRTWEKSASKITEHMERLVKKPRIGLNDDKLASISMGL